MENVTDILTRTLERVKAKIQERIVAEGRSASGSSASSLTVEVNGTKGVIIGSRSLLSMERGRGPGKVPYGFFDIIKEWIKAKGISVTPKPSKREAAISSEERGLRSLAGAIAYTIMKKGTKLHRKGGYNDIYDTALNEELEVLGKEITFGLAEQIFNINNNI